MIPMLLIAIASVLTLSWISDRYKNRVIPIIFCAILQLLGFVGMSSFHKADGKYFISIVITCIGVYSGTPSYLTWVTTHYVGSTRTAFATALVLCFGSLGALTSPLASPITTGKEHYLETFKENSPVYIVNWVFASLIIVNTLLLNFLLSNRLRLQHVDQKQQLDQHQVNR